MALLQPPPEVYELFDDIMLLSEGMPGSGAGRAICSHAVPSVLATERIHNAMRRWHMGHSCLVTLSRSCGIRGGVTRMSGTCLACQLACLHTESGAQARARYLS